MAKKDAITMVIDVDEIPGAPDPEEILIGDPLEAPIEPPELTGVEDPPVEDPPPADPEEPPEVMGVEEDDEWRSQTTSRLEQIEKDLKGIPTQVISSLEKKENSRKKSQGKGRRRLLKF